MAKVKYIGKADIRILPKDDLKEKAGVEHELLRFDRANDWTADVDQSIIDWLVENDAFDVAD